LWRSLTVQTLHHSGGKSTDLTRRQILQQKSKFCEQRANRVLESCGALLHPLEGDKAVERQKDLIGMIESFDEFSASIHAQNVRIRVLASEEDFKDVGETTFSAGSRLMSAHASLKLHDKDDKSRDGSAIYLLIQPAIIAYNCKRSETDNEYRVWLKAVVWMGGDSHDDNTFRRTTGAKRGTLKGNRTGLRSRQVIYIDDSEPEGESVDPKSGVPKVAPDSLAEGPENDTTIINTDVKENTKSPRTSTMIDTAEAKSTKPDFQYLPEKGQTQAKRACDDCSSSADSPKKKNRTEQCANTDSPVSTVENMEASPGEQGTG
jgi:hypothetical protein